ncbi:MAG: sigma-E processing peptidase SpoIIGA [Lachnospiraceae bacterium]|nr:sigma-E processing peptidase SpoIIGA [Lachnospiraceae bacterium]
MYYELYLDVLFLQNLLADYLLLTILKGSLKCQAGRLRRLAGAAVGSLGVCGVYLFSIESTWIGRLLIYIIFSTVMVSIGLGIRDWRGCIKAVVLLYISSFLLGGIFQWVRGRLRFPVYSFSGFTLISYWILSASMKWLMELRARVGNVFETVVGFHGRTIEVKGLLDTGNQLRDPIFQRPVSILTEHKRQELCSGEEPLYQMIPFHSIGEPSGLMPAFYADYLCIRKGKGREKRVERPLLGVTKEPLSSQKEYDMILHPDLLE